MKHIKWTHKTDKNTEKMPSKEEDWLFFLVSTQQPTLMNIGCFWEYFVPMSIVLQVNLTSFFKFSSISIIINLSGLISMILLCSCYILNFWFYVQFDQLDAKYNCTLYHLHPFYHKVSLNRNECSFS